MKVTYTNDEKLEPLRHLLREALPDQDHSTSEEVAGLSNTQLRDRLIAHKPLDRDWIARINQVQVPWSAWCIIMYANAIHSITSRAACCSSSCCPEQQCPGSYSVWLCMQADAEYWKRSEGYRVGWSDEILGFDCGGEQWVLEVAFPTGTLKYVSNPTTCHTLLLSAQGRFRCSQPSIHFRRISHLIFHDSHRVSITAHCAKQIFTGGKEFFTGGKETGSYSTTFRNLYPFCCMLSNWIPRFSLACRKPSNADLDFMKDLMREIEEAGVPAPSPIEQRWTASSSASMSPASARGRPDTVHSWVGIIMYLPTEEEAQRQAITDRWE